MKIEILVSPTGEVRLETRGFSGPACQDASRFLRQALGQTTAEQLTSEYHQQSTTQTAQQTQSS